MKLNRRLWLIMTPTVLLLVTAVSCRQYLFQFQSDELISGTQTEITITKPSQSDILFVIDDSGSMAANQQNLETNIGAFINQLAQSDNIFQIAITTTDMNLCDATSSYQDQPTPPAASGPYYPGGASNQYDGKCGRFISFDGSDPIMRRTDLSNADLITKFQNNVGVVGTKGSAWEQGLKAAYTAVAPSSTAPGTQDAYHVNNTTGVFVRPDALLVVVIVTDESDCSFPPTSAGYNQFIETDLFNPSSDPSGLLGGEACYKFANLLDPPETWAQRITGVKGSTNLVTVGIISGMVGSTDNSGNSTLIASNCNIDGSGQPTNDCSCFLNNGLNFCQYTAPVATPPADITPCSQQTGLTGGESAGALCHCDAAKDCCRSLANNRYVDFAKQFAGGPILLDSICKTDYSQTLYNLANIATRDCFTIPTPPLNGDQNNMQVKLRPVGSTTFSIVPSVSPSVGFNGNGWFYLPQPNPAGGAPTPFVCLAGNYKRNIGDTYQIFAVDGANGVASTQPSN